MLLCINLQITHKKQIIPKKEKNNQMQYDIQRKDISDLKKRHIDNKLRERNLILIIL